MLGSNSRGHNHNRIVELGDHWVCTRWGVQMQLLTDAYSTQLRVGIMEADMEELQGPKV